MSNQPETIQHTSLDIAAENRAQLKQLFPTVFTETRNDQGELTESIDFEKLKAELGTFSDTFESRRERYGMEWPGKKEALHLIQTLSSATLKPCRAESVNFDTTENLFIEGDNLEVLKLLQTSHYGKVKMIYIDPPYNTGKEFIYPDNFSESLETYLEYAGLIDGEGKKFSTNTANEGRFHTKWLNMMYPRLYLARNLLRDDGVIFISIDDNEVSNLRKMCDEIFGEENQFGIFLWKRRQNPDSRNQSNISPDHEYVIAYAKNSSVELLGVDIDTAKYQNPDNDSRGAWASIDLSGLATKEQRPNLHYDIIDPKTAIAYPPNPNRGWSKSKAVVTQMITEGRVLFPKSPEGRPREKNFLNDLKSDITGFSTWLDSKEVGFTTHGTRELTKLFDNKIFDFPKPSRLIKLLVKQTTETDDLILDFFAGSATTAHAVLDLNKQDNGNRKFILVQLPEPCAPESEAFKAGYKTIADIGKERIRRVINKLGSQSLTPPPPLRGEGGKRTMGGSSSPLPSGEGWGGASDSVSRGGAFDSASRGGALYATANPTLWDALKVNARDMRKNPTPAEDALWQEVRNKKWGIAFRRQHAIEQFIADFVCLEHTLIVEIDGDIHQYQTERDAERTAILESLGYTVIRFSNDEVLHNIQHVKSSILNVLGKLHRQSSPPASYLQNRSFY